MQVQPSSRVPLTLWLMALSVVLSIGGQRVRAEASGPDFYQLRTDVALAGPVHLYQENRSDSDVISEQVPSATALKNLGCTGQPTFQQWREMDAQARAQARENVWCKVAYEGLQGWIQNVYLAEFSSPLTPSFDCQQAQGTIETLICGDAELSALDRKLDKVFDEALATAKGLGDRPERAVKTLNATQRGWIKGRNDCWKAVDKRVCTQQQYTQRIAFLEADWALVAASAPRLFRCENPREEFIVTLFETQTLPAAAVVYGDSRDIFVAAAGDSVYQGAFGRSLWLEGQQGGLRWDQSQPEKVCTMQ